MTTATKSARYDLVLNVPATIDIKYVDVWPDKNGYGSQVSVKGTINGETQTIYLKGKSWANLKALQQGGVIGAYDKSIEEPAEKVNLPVENGANVTLVMQKLPADKYANLVVMRTGQQQPANNPPSFTSPGAPPNFLAEQDDAEAQFLASVREEQPVQAKTAGEAGWNALFAHYDKCLEFILSVEAPKLRKAGVEVTHEGLSAQTATLLIAAKDRRLAA